MTYPAIDVRDATKHLRGRPVLQAIRLRVPEGACLGITGPNGAGKSMLLRLLSGLIYPDEGEVYVFGLRLGEDVEFPPQLGALIDQPGFLPQYSAWQNLRLLASIRGRTTPEQIRRVLRQVGLDPDDPRPVRAFSTGMRQRLGVAQALMEDPRLLLLDEPTRGLDPDGARTMVRLIHAYHHQAAGARTTVLVTHHRAQWEGVCTHWAAMYDGRLVVGRKTDRS